MTWEDAKEFRDIVVDVWINGLFGVDIGRYVVAVLIFVFFLGLRRLFTRFVSGRLRNFTEKTTNDFDNRLVAALEPPIRFVPVVMGIFFAAQHLNLDGMAATFVYRINRSLIVIVIFWGLLNAIEPLAFWFRRLERIFTPSLVEWIIKAIKGAFVFIGIATVLEVWGIQIGPIIAGMGLVGVAVALGAQDMFKNLISGILILSERRFKRGDWIRVEGVVEGTVEVIGFRSTLVRRFDKAPVFVPNARLSDNPVVNFSQMTYRRIFWEIGIKYGATVDQLREIRDGIAAHLIDSPDFATPPLADMFVRIDRFGESSIDMMLYCFTRTTAWGEWLRIKEELAFAVKTIVENAGAGFALPGRAVYVEAVPGGSSERMPVPGAEEGTEPISTGSRVALRHGKRDASSAIPRNRER